MPDKNKAMAQVLGDVQRWENESSLFFRDFNRHADAYRMLSPNRRVGTQHLSNTRTAETARATETLATLIFRMMTSSNPNFQLVSRHPNFGDRDLVGPEAVLKFNQHASQYRRRLMKALRSGVLFGSVPVELGWDNNFMLGVEGPTMIPKSLLQFAFDPFVSEIDQSDWFATIDYITEQRLKDMVTADQAAKDKDEDAVNVWDEAEIRRGLGQRNSRGFSVWIQERLTNAGYTQIQKGLNEVITWYGKLPDQSDKMWVVTILNRNSVIRFHESPYNDIDGLAPFEIANFTEFELEAFGYGVGKFGHRLQRELDANRNRYQDLITFSLFNMWEIPKSAGITRVLIKPLMVLRPTEAGQINPLRPDLAALGPGIKLEDVFKDDFRALTGATSNLQAVVTKATATESSIAQTESIRKVSVIAELMAEPLIRRTLLRWHGRNMKWMDSPLWLGIAGSPKPVMVSKSDLRIPLDVDPRIVTDKDFRPQRLEAINFGLQTLVTLAREDSTVDVKPQVKALANELLRTLGVNIDPIKPLAKMADRAEGVLSGKNELLREVAETPDIVDQAGLATPVPRETR